MPTRSRGRGRRDSRRSRRWEEGRQPLGTISDAAERSPEQKEFDFPIGGPRRHRSLCLVHSRRDYLDQMTLTTPGRKATRRSINGRIIAASSSLTVAASSRRNMSATERRQDEAIHVLAVGLMELNETATAVAADLIWHANSKTGRCDPSVDRISFESIGLGDRSPRAARTRRRQGDLEATARSIDQRLSHRLDAAAENPRRVRGARKRCHAWHIGGATHSTSGVTRLSP